MAKTITLGDPRRGIILGNLKLRLPDKFLVERDSQSGIVTLKNHAREFKLLSDGEHVFIELWGQWYLFEPFLQIDWLKRMVGVKAST